MQELDELPEDMSSVIELMRKLKAEKAQADERRFESLCRLISKRRDEAVKHRESSGIEQIWQEDQEFYEGIDDYNSTVIKYHKPIAPGGPLTKKTQHESDQCTAFFNMTRQFVDSGSARCGDILLPQGDWNWGVKKTPIAESVVEQEANRPDMVNPVVEQQQAMANEAVKKGEQRIKDWLVETKYHKEYRKALEYSARIGTGIMKGPFPVSRKAKARINGQLTVEQKVVPASKAIDPWNFYPDASCGDDIQRGDGVFERDFLTYKQLADLKEISGEYITDAIDKVLKEGPNKKYSEQSLKHNESDVFEVWFFTGNIDLNDMDLLDERFRQDVDIKQNEEGTIEICGCDEAERGKDFQSVVIVLVNETIIKGHLNPLDNGEFPYDVMCWQRVDDSPFGIGIARQMRVAQMLLLSSGRNLVDNTALSSVPMIAMRRSGVEPENSKWEIKKGKVWWLTDEQIRTIAESIQFLTVPSMQKELMEIMALAGKMAEDATGINSLLQGQQGSAPDTVGGMELLHKNASALLRRIARLADENLTEPHIKRYYDWLLMYGEDSEKGDFSVEAIGSSILVEREVEAQEAQLLLNYSQDPEYQLSKNKILSKIIKGWGIEPSDVMMSEEEKAAAAQKAQQQQPQDPRIQVAQLNAQTDLQLAQQKAQVDLQIAQQDAQVEAMKVKQNADRDAIFAAGVTERNQVNYQAQIAKLQLERELAMLQYAHENQTTLDKIKSELAQTSLKLSVQKELAAMDADIAQKEMIKPAIEPPGKADKGKSFQQ